MCSGWKKWQSFKYTGNLVNKPFPVFFSAVSHSFFYFNELTGKEYSIQSLYWDIKWVLYLIQDIWTPTLATSHLFNGFLQQKHFWFPIEPFKIEHNIQLLVKMSENYIITALLAPCLFQDLYEDFNLIKLYFNSQ